LDILYEGPGISKLQFLIKKDIKQNSALFSIFGHQNPESGSGIGTKESGSTTLAKTKEKSKYLTIDMREMVG
jgi:hypothetical protein